MKSSIFPLAETWARSIREHGVQKNRLRRALIDVTSSMACLQQATVLAKWGSGTCPVPLRPLM